MGKSERTKGRAEEQRVARLLRDIGIDAKRGWQCASGTDAPDVITDFFSVECKHRRRPNVKAALDQADQCRIAGTAPVAWCRWHGEGEGVVSMHESDWLQIVEGWLSWVKM